MRDIKDVQGLTKEFIINDEKVYLTTSQIGTVFSSELLEKIATLKKGKDEIKNSIDFLIYGF